MIVDDTSCKNKFGFPIIAAIAFDENKASQLIAFGLIHGKSIDDFDQFFLELSKKFTIRVFVCDRLRSQTKSILKYFNSHIVYCRIHIRRNIISYCNDEILEGFEELIRGELSKSAFLNILTAFKATSIEGQKHLKYLITDIDSYAPEELIKLRLRDIRTSNDVESFFGSYKNLTDHDILTIDECVNSIILRYKMLITRSLSFSYKCELPKDIYDGPQIGIDAYTIILKQYDLMKDGIKQIIQKQLTEEEYMSSCKNSVYNEYSLQCEHMLFKTYTSRKKTVNYRR